MNSSPDYAPMDAAAPVSKRDRLMEALRRLEEVPACSSGLEMYRNLCEALNHVEDRVLGAASWNPPRSYLGSRSSDRLYPTFPESMLPVPDVPGVTALWHATEVVFISRYGAIEVEEKDHRDLQTIVGERRASKLFARLDMYGDDVWHPKNRV